MAKEIYADDDILLQAMKHLRIQVPDTHEVGRCMKHSLRCHQQLSERDVYWETVRNHPVQLERDWGEKRKKHLLIERREQKTRYLKSEFALLGMKFAKKTRHNFLNVKDELFEDVSILLKNKISRSEFEAINKLELFGHGYLIGGAVKWRQPFALKDIAETLGCTDEYQHYIKLFQAYISERSIRSNCGEKINLFTDKEWWVNEDEDQVQDLADVIDAVEKHFPEDVRFSIQEKRSKEEGEKDKVVAAVNRNGATADQNATTEEELPYLAGGNVKIKHLNIIQIY